MIEENCQKSSAFDKSLIMRELQKIVKKNSNVLDVGFGDGKFTCEVKKKFKLKKIWGIDVEKGSKEIDSVQLDLNYPPYDYNDKIFDVIISIQNIEHLYFTDDYLNELRRIMKDEGHLILTTTNLAGIHYRLMLLLGMQPICLHPSEYQVFPLKGRNPRYGHKSVFTFYALAHVLRMHNFEIIKSYTHTIYFLPGILSSLICKVFPNLGTFSCYVCRKVIR